MAKIKVTVNKRTGKPGAFYFMALGKTYHLIPGQEIEIDEKIMNDFGQYFTRVKEETKKEVKVEKTEKTETKRTGLAEFLEMKKKVADMGINTSGMKKEDLEKVLKDKK